jgi:hypothetical protein
MYFYALELCFLGLNFRHLMPEDSKTTDEGIFVDLKFMALHPLGNFSSHVIKK